MDNSLDEAMNCCCYIITSNLLNIYISFPGITLYDLPGVGTPRYPKETYLSLIDFSRYDFFVIMSKSRFTSNDLWLAQEVSKREKNFVFVRTKIDEDIQNDRDDFPSTHNETRVLQRMKQDVKENLDCLDDVPPVFLISGRRSNIHKWEFRLLSNHLTRLVPLIRQQEFVLSQIKPKVSEEPASSCCIQ